MKRCGASGRGITGVYDTILAEVEAQFVPLLISVFGGGTIVPLIYRWWGARRTRDIDDQRATAQVEEIAAHAAREAVEATRAAMYVLRRQLADGHDEIDALRQQHGEDREEIKRLRARVRELSPPPTP